MLQTSKIALTGLLAAMLAACTTVPSQQDQGVVIGAIAGGVLGNQVGGGSGRVIATIVGTVAGAAIGGKIGRSMDEQDRMKTAMALENVRTGVSSTWVNPDNGYEYTVTPTSTQEYASGPCREYTVNARIGGGTEQVYGTACRQPDGSWRGQN